MTRPRIAVVGGGITGLAAAYELRNDADVTVFEASDRLGGKIRTDELDGIQVEAGADSLLARDDEPLRVLRDLGLADDIVEPRDFGAWIASDGGIKRLPEGFVLGVPASPIAVLRSGLVSPLGMLRAAADLVLPRSDVGDDISVGGLVRARFGHEVADRIVAPLMSGVRSGNIDEMSLDMAAPEIASAARSGRSVMLGLRKELKAMRRPRFIGLKRGMSSLIDALRARSRAEIALRTRVETLQDDLTIDGRAFDGVVITAPPHVASSLLGIHELADISFSGITVVNLVYPAGSLSLPRSGTGILVAPDRNHQVVACTWFSKKWPHIAPADGRIVIRCVATPGARESVVSAEVAELVRTAAAPLASKTQRWDAALPEFTIGHRKRIETVAAALRGRPVRVAGAGYLATGINDCLAHGRAAAHEVLQAARA